MIEMLPGGKVRADSFDDIGSDFHSFLNQIHEWHRDGNIVLVGEHKLFPNREDNRPSDVFVCHIMAIVHFYNREAAST